MNSTTDLPALITSTTEARKNYLLFGSCIYKAIYEHYYSQLYRLAFDYDRLVVTCPDALEALHRLTTDVEFPHFLRLWIYSGLPEVCRAAPTAPGHQNF